MKTRGDSPSNPIPASIVQKHRFCFEFLNIFISSAFLLMTWLLRGICPPKHRCWHPLSLSFLPNQCVFGLSSAYLGPSWLFFPLKTGPIQGPSLIQGLVFSTFMLKGSPRPLWHPLGVSLGLLLGPCWAILGPSWAHVGPSWGHLGAFF